MKEQWLKSNAALLDFSPCLYHTKLINRQEGIETMDAKLIEKLRKQYIKNPPEGMTSNLVKNMTDSDLLDMHYFLTEDDDLNDDELEEGFYIDFF